MVVGLENFDRETDLTASGFLDFVEQFVTRTLTIPDFVQEADEKHPGLAEEYTVLARLVTPLLAERQSDTFRHTLLLQCGIAWQHYNATILLLANRFGVQALALGRTLFELVLGALYLLKNPSLLPDFLDCGKLAFYDSAVEVNVDVGPIRSECEEIRARLAKRKGRKDSWHGKKMEELAGLVGLGQGYRAFYKDASGAVHADASKTLSWGSRGWSQSLRVFADKKQSAVVRYGSFMGTGSLFLAVNEDLHLGHKEETKALFLLMQERYNRLSRPN